MVGRGARGGLATIHGVVESVAGHRDDAGRGPGGYKWRLSSWQRHGGRARGSHSPVDGIHRRTWERIQPSELHSSATLASRRTSNACINPARPRRPCRRPPYAAPLRAQRPGSVPAASAARPHAALLPTRSALPSRVVWNVAASNLGVSGGGIMLHARRPVGPVAAAQKCATHDPLSVRARGGGCTAWSSMRRFGWRLSRRV